MSTFYSFSKDASPKAQNKNNDSERLEYSDHGPRLTRGREIEKEKHLHI